MNTPIDSFIAPSLLADASTMMSWLPSLAMIACIVVMGAIMAISFNRRERQLRTLALQISNDLEEAKALRSQLDEAHTLASNMMVTAQRLAARLDERVAALDMASLRMSATRNALPRTSAPLSPARTSTPYVAAEVSLSPVLSSIEHAMAPPKTGSRSASALMEAPSRATMEFKTTSVRVPHDALAQQVYALADGGHPALDIARELGEHIGKVELILALRQ